jgi:NAD+ diphosphatase
MSADFLSAVAGPPDGGAPALWFVFKGDRLLAKVVDREAVLPSSEDLDQLNLNLLRNQYLGTLGHVHCLSAEVSEETEAPDGWSFQGLRRLYSMLDEGAFGVAGRAVQIVDWDRTHQYCGRCGSLTRNHPRDRAKECTSCGLISYPRISPAIIVLVRKNDRLLMARAHRHPPGFYSVLAGFVEPGETLEEAVAREIREEVGIEVRDIQYFGSQPWPFPNSLMIAYTCHYVAGDIVLEEAELEDAGWFTADKLPPCPPKISIARQLIDWFVDSQGGVQDS